MPTPTYTRNGFSEFVPELCCAHDWKPLPTHGEQCPGCGAVCHRDTETGLIIDYNRPSPKARKEIEHASVNA